MRIYTIQVNGNGSSDQLTVKMSTVSSRYFVKANGYLIIGHKNKRDIINISYKNRDTKIGGIFFLCKESVLTVRTSSGYFL